MPQSNDEIRSAYDRATVAYAEQFLLELDGKPADLRLLRRFAEEIGSGQFVLDLGCGPGHTTAHLDALGLRSLGVDLSPQMIAKASEQFPESQFAVGDFMDLQQPDSTAAGILAFYCIVHLQKSQLKGAFKEMYRVLQPNGILVASFHIGEETICVDSFLGTEAYLEFSFFSTITVSDAMIGAGFADLEINERPPYDAEHPSRRCYIWGRKPASSA